MTKFLVSQLNVITFVYLSESFIKIYFILQNFWYVFASTPKPQQLQLNTPRMIKYIKDCILLIFVFYSV